MDTGLAVSAVLGANDQAHILVLAGGRLEQLLLNVLNHFFTKGLVDFVSWFLSSGCFGSSLVLQCWSEGVKTEHFTSKQAMPCREVCWMQGSGLWLRIIAHCYLCGCILYKEVG